MIVGLYRYTRPSFLNYLVALLLSHIIIMRAVALKSVLSLKPVNLIRSTSRCLAIGSPASNETSPSADYLGQWNLQGLKGEIIRQQNRTFKKVSKVQQRLTVAEEKYNSIIATPNPPLELLETCPDPDTIKEELGVLQSRLRALNQVEEQLKTVTSSTDDLFKAIVPTIKELKLADKPPPKQPRGPKKVKQKAPLTPRLPYAVYSSEEGIEIRVGRTASDNDELSCNPELRDGDDWWMHASGCPGSHVVVRYHGSDLLTAHRQTVIDAALLAAVNSKKKNDRKVPVSLTRCKCVSKPRGAKPGLVYLNGDVTTINVDLRAEAARLDRLKRGQPRSNS